MKELVQKALEKIRPNLQADGGDVELIDVGGGRGGKGKTHGRLSRLSDGPDDAQKRIEKFLKQEVPTVKSVVSG